MTTTISLPTITRPTYHDVADLDAVFRDGDHDLVEPKYDGRWVTVHVQTGIAVAYSCTGRRQFRRSVAGDLPDAVLVGEYLFGTSWSLPRNRSDARCVRVFDVVRYDGEDLTSEPLSVRRRCLSGILADPACPAWLLPVAQWPIERAAEAWSQWVEREGFEGLVFKSSEDAYGEPWARFKRVVTTDYVCMAVLPGSGVYADVAGSLQGGLFVNGRLRAVCRVGGLTDRQRRVFWRHRDLLVGRTFEAAGQKLMESGALRHPRFVRWRPEK